MMTKSKMFISIIVLLLIGCNSLVWEEVKIGDRFSLSLPDLMIATERSDSTIVCMNPRESFVVKASFVLDKSLTDTTVTEQPTDSVSSMLRICSMFGNNSYESIFDHKIFKTVHVCDTVINSMPAIINSIEGKSDGNDIFMYTCYAESKKSIYEIITMISTSDKYSKEDDMLRVIYSLKEL